MKINLQDLKYFIGESNLNVPNLLEILLEALQSEEGHKMILRDLKEYIEMNNKE